MDNQYKGIAERTELIKVILPPIDKSFPFHISYFFSTLEIRISQSWGLNFFQSWSLKVLHYCVRI